MLSRRKKSVANKSLTLISTGRESTDEIMATKIKLEDLIQLLCQCNGLRVPYKVLRKKCKELINNKTRGYFGNLNVLVTRLKIFEKWSVGKENIVTMMS